MSKAGWQTKTLGEVLEKTATANPLLAPEAEFDYIDVSSVSNESFQIEETQRLKGKDAPSRARRQVRTNDLIFATIRPTLRRIAVVPERFDKQVCSTGYFVLRPKPLIDYRFMYNWLFSAEFMGQMEALQKGASYPAVTDAEVRAQKIPFPPLSEQLRIVAILDAAFDHIATARANCEANLLNARELVAIGYQAIASSFKDSNWQKLRVADVAAPRKGAIRTGPFGSQLLHSEFVDEGIAVLGIDNAVKNEFQWDRRRFITSEKFQQLSRYMVYPGDVLITIMGTCGRCAVVPNDIPVAINTKHLCCITLDPTKCLPDYLHMYFLYAPLARDYLTKQAKGSIMEGLNMGIIVDLPLMLPSISIQKQIVAKFDAIREETQRLASLYQRKRQALDDLKKSLLHQAFSGLL